MNSTCSVCTELGRPCSHHPARPTAGPKLTPRQNALLKQLRTTPDGIALEDAHSATVEGLTRRGLVTVWQGRVVLTDDDDTPDAA